MALISRILVVLVGLLSLLSVVQHWFRPETLVAERGLQVIGDIGRANMRADVGGIFLGIGLFAADYVKTVLYESFGVIAWALILGGVAMLGIERFRPAPQVTDAAETPIWRAICVGVFQTFALIPGVSRSGATIYGGLLLGLDRRAAAEFSFFLAMPTMAAAFAYDFMEVKDHITPDRIAEIAVGFVFAFISAALVVKPFLEFVTRIGFGPFAWYRIGVGALVLGAMYAGWL